MSREWKPGDVVTATVKGRENVRLVAGWSRYDPQLRWCEMSPRWGDGDDDECWFMPNDVTDHRRLVALDPEDREAVERLAALWAGHAGEFDTIPGRMATILREFANPTPAKPDEPTGLGAVVEDDKGRKWVRSDETDDLPWHEPDSGDSDWRNYADIAVVRVLSEGVQP